MYRHLKLIHDMDTDDYEVVSRNQTSLEEARVHGGLTNIRGQCYYCLEVFQCKNLRGLRVHQRVCRQKATCEKSGKRTGRGGKTTRQVIIDGGHVSDDDDNIEPPSTPPQPAHCSAASKPTELEMHLMSELQQSRSKIAELKSELSAEKAKRCEIADKCIQLLEQSRST